MDRSDNVTTILDDGVMTNRLREFVKYLDNAIDAEMSKFPLSKEDAIRKSSYCLGLERDKRAIYNILDGHDFNYIGTEV